jgi:hypothetical protein
VSDLNRDKNDEVNPGNLQAVRGLRGGERGVKESFEEFVEPPPTPIISCFSLHVPLTFVQMKLNFLVF